METYPDASEYRRNRGFGKYTRRDLCGQWKYKQNKKPRYRLTEILLLSRPDLNSVKFVSASAKPTAASYAQSAIERNGERCDEKSCMCYQIDTTPRGSSGKLSDHKNQVDSTRMVADISVPLLPQD